AARRRGGGGGGGAGGGGAGGPARVPGPAGPRDGGGVAGARAGFARPGRPVVLAVGRLAPQKGFATLLAAAARWQGRDPCPVIALAGQGPLDRALRAPAGAGGSRGGFPGQRGVGAALVAGGGGGRGASV